MFNEFGEQITIAEMINELDESAFAIIHDEDRNFVQATKILIEIGEPISTKDAERVITIYQEFQKLMHQSMEIK